MDTRERILDATVRLYAELGYRGTTTRRIAETAGVNEVTLFRLFGSKSALIEAAVRLHKGWSVHTLPELPADPLAEVTAWCRDQIASIGRMRDLLRTFMCDMHGHPEIRDSVRASPMLTEEGLSGYIERLRDAGLAASDIDVRAAAHMLSGAIFGDVMGRDVCPDQLPQPESEAPALYARLFLRAIGVAVPPVSKNDAGGTT